MIFKKTINENGLAQIAAFLTEHVGIHLQLNGDAIALFAEMAEKKMIDGKPPTIEISEFFSKNSLSQTLNIGPEGIDPPKFAVVLGEMSGWNENQESFSMGWLTSENQDAEPTVKVTYPAVKRFTKLNNDTVRAGVREAGEKTSQQSLGSAWNTPKSIVHERIGDITDRAHICPNKPDLMNAHTTTL